MSGGWLPWWSALVLGVALLLAAWWRHYSTQFSRRGLPSIPPLPLVGNMLQLVMRRASMHDVIEDVYKKLAPYSYGGIFAISIPLIFVRDPEVIRAVTVKDFDHFTDHEDMFGARKTKCNAMIKRALISLTGKEWHDMRTTLSPAFTSLKMKNMFLFMAETAQQMVDYLEKKVPENEGDKELTLDMKEFFSRVTNDIIATTAFGLKVDSLAEPNNTFYSMGRDLTIFKSIVTMGYMLSPKLMEFLGITFLDKKTEGFFRSIVNETMETREREGIVRQDMLHLLMQARRGELFSEEEENNGSTTSNGNRRITEDDVLGQALTFFLGGFESVSTMATFCSYLLATHPDVQDRLQKEVDDVVRKRGGHPNYEDVMGCQYLDMVVSETLRLYAPSPVLDRLCVRPYRLPATDSSPGLDLQPGDSLWIPVHGIHRDPRYFPDPDVFNPDRFSPENRHRIQPFTYFPFGIGPRFCIAQRFALMKTKVLLLYLLSTLSLHVVSKTPVPLKIDPTKTFLTIEGGAWLGIQRRQFNARLTNDTGVLIACHKDL